MPEVTRRTLLLGAAGGGAFVLSGATTAHAAPRPGRLITETVLAVAAAAAIFPGPFPRFGENGPATSRVTAVRLERAWLMLSRDRARLVEKGSGLVVRKVDLGDRESTLTGLGLLYDRSAAEGQRPLVALTSLAIATISRHFRPDDDSMATLGLEGLAELVRREGSAA